MSCRRVLKSIQALAAHTLLFCFTLFLVLKLDHTLSSSWWMVFLPLWAFHAVVARGRFSLPAPVAPRNRHWAPCHAVVATPLLVAFELLLCIYLESSYGSWPPAVSLKVASLPLLAFEVTILIDNLRMCRALMPGDDDSTSDEAIWEALPHLWVAISMVFTLAATFFTLLKLSGDKLFFSEWFNLQNIYILTKLYLLRLLGWWSIDEGNREEQARLYIDGESGYNTFSGHPPEIVKKMPKEDLAEEEKVLCRVCFEREISLVLLPCRHRVLCRLCSDKCKKCPACRITIEERLPVYDV
uniref:RING-type domain-containing protein n=1 Tax=Brassica campestris TaxID=3711 RepID=M4DJ79_BRACM